jgi:hypothetical protein
MQRGVDLIAMSLKSGHMQDLPNVGCRTNQTHSTHTLDGFPIQKRNVSHIVLREALINAAMRPFAA